MNPFMKQERSGRNRIANTRNPNQGDYKRVLCVCSAGMLRSPTLAWVLSNKPYNFNTRAAGLIEDYALIPVDDALLIWAEEIVCVECSQQKAIEEYMKELNIERPVHCLSIPDSFQYRDLELVEAIHEALKGVKFGE